MAPKKKEAAKAADVPAGPSLEELQAQLDALLAEKDKEANERNRAQLDRDKASSLLEIKRKECEQAEAELRNKAREIEASQEKHQTDLKVFSQRMKHLMYEQQTMVDEFKTANGTSLRSQRQQAASRETELMNEQHELKEKIKEVEHSYEEMIKQMKLDHSKEISKMKQEFDHNAKELLVKTNNKIKRVQAENDLRRKQEYHEIEERKNSHIQELTKKHDKAFTEIKGYYNEITLNNLDLIKTLKEDIHEMKMKEKENEKLMHEVSEENRRLTEPLTKALKEVESLRKQLAHHEKDRRSLQQLRAQQADTMRHSKELEWQFNTLKSKLEKIQAERDSLKARFEASVLEAQQKCQVKSKLLQKQADALGNQLDQKEVQLNAAIKMAKLDVNSTHIVRHKVETIIEQKNQQIKSLYFELGRLSGVYNAVIGAFKTKMAELGIPLEETGLSYFVSARGL